MRAAQNDIVLESVVVESHDGPEAGRATSEPNPAATLQASLENEAAPHPWFLRKIPSVFAIASKLAALASLVLTAVMAWPAIASSTDTKLATLLAKWTSEKEYLEFCEAHDWDSDGCAMFRGAALPPPPTRLTVFRRYLEGDRWRRRTSLDGMVGGHDEHPVLTLPGCLYHPCAANHALFRAVRLVFGVVLGAATLLCILYALRRIVIGIRAIGRADTSRDMETWQARPRSGGDKSFLDYLLEQRAAATREQSSARTTGADTTDVASMLEVRRERYLRARELALRDVLTTNMRLRRRGARVNNPLKRKLRRNPPRYGGDDSPETSGDDAFVAKKRVAKLPERPRIVGRI